MSNSKPSDEKRAQWRDQWADALSPGRHAYVSREGARCTGCNSVFRNTSASAQLSWLTQHECSAEPLATPDEPLGGPLPDDLLARILAAIEEAERIARKAVNFRPYPSDGQWRPGWRPSPSRLAVLAGNYPVADYIDRESGYAEHIAGQHPHATLIRCAADRRTVERHRAQRDSGLPTHRRACAWCHRDDRVVRFPCPDLLDRAEAYGITVEEEQHG